MEQRVRRLKISYTWNPRIAYGDTGFKGARYTRVPFIRLGGQWLRNLGFEQGDRITVWPKKKKLIITLDKKTRSK
jgi:hypothetical protein